MAEPGVLIVDSGMRTVGGHNFSYTRAVQAAFSEKGVTVSVLANRGLPSELAETSGFKPLFSCGTYDHPLGHGRLRDLAYVYAQSHVFSEELEHGLDCVLPRKYSLIFCHTLRAFELIGWSRYLARREFAGALALVLRQTPRYRTSGRLRRALNPYWRLEPHYLGKLHRRLGERFLLCTDSEPLSEDYARIYSGRILTLPIPLSRALFDARLAPASTITSRYPLTGTTGIRVGYLGDARTSKGFPLLAGLVKQIAAAGAQARFIIQCPRPGSGDDQATLPEGLAELRELAGDPLYKLTLIPEKLSTPDYAELFRHLDVILLPYLHPTYREATSGIFAEALALAKPVVVPSDTWMARELSKWGCGIVFPRERPSDLAGRLLELLQRYPGYAAAAERTSGPWRAFHNPDMLAEILLTEAGLPPRLN